MLSPKVDNLLLFHSPTTELLQQREIHLVAKKYYDFFGFSDNAIVFLNRYMTENFSFLNYFDKCTNLMNQGCHKFSSAWANLQQDPSPLISILLLQVNNISTLTSSFVPLEFKAEEQIRDDYTKKIASLKTIQQAIDKKFQALWKQCHLQTANYYQSLEEYKEQTAKVRQKYESYEKERDQKAYNVTYQQRLDANMNEKLVELKKKREAFDKVSIEAQETYQGLLAFFEANRDLFESFHKVFLSTLMEIIIVILEKAHKSFVYMKQATSEIVGKLNKVQFMDSWETESRYIRSHLPENVSYLDFLKEMNRINHQRHEALNAYGHLSQDTMHICEDFIEKFIYFEEKNAFETFISHFDNKASSVLSPFTQFFDSFKQLFIGFFSSEKIDSEQIVEKLAHKRSQAYSTLISNVSEALKEPNLMRFEAKSNSPSLPSPKLSPQDKMDVIKKELSAFVKLEETLARELLKDLERLFGGINQGLFNKVIQVCQKSLAEFQGRKKDERLTVEAKRIQASFTKEEEEENVSSLNVSMTTGSTMDEFEVVAEEGREPSLTSIDRYNGEFKFLQEKKAEVLDKVIRRRNEELLERISPMKGKEAKEGERELGNYSCAFVDSILLQGRIYISTAKVVFKSYFNAKTLFGSTVLSIPLEDVLTVVKKKNALGLENMIEITTKKGKLEFTSFVAREKAYALMNQIMDMNSSKALRERKSVKEGMEELPELECDNELLLQEPVKGEGKEARRLRRQQQREMEWQRRNKQVLKVMPSLAKYESLGYQHHYEIDFNAFAQVVLSNTEITFKGKKHDNFWALYEHTFGTYNIFVGDWNTKFPRNVKDKRELVKFQNELERNTSVTKDLSVSMPMFPKSLSYKQKQTMWFVNDGLISLHLDVNIVEKIPLADAFKPMTAFLFKDTMHEGKKVVTVEFRYYFIWFYDTIFKKMLQKKTVEEVLSAGPVFNKLIHDLIEDGEFERRRREHENQASQEQQSEEEDDGSLEEENTADAEVEEELEAPSQDVEDSKKMAGVEEKQVESSGKEFRVSKRVIFIYFSMALVLLSILSIKMVNEGKAW